MYLYLGESTVVNERDVVGIFDIENTSISKHTKEFLANAQKNNVINVSMEMPKSFVVCMINGHQTVYISQISVSTLRKRANGKAGNSSIALL